MVHYIRFLKTPRVERCTSKTVSVIALVTIETDLGDTFLLSDASLKSCLVRADEPGNVLCQEEVHWQGGSRELPLRLTACIGQTSSLLRLHVFSAKDTGSIPSILDVWSAPFQPTLDSRAAAWVERRLYLSGLPVIRIWEETGNSIARHIW